MVTTPFPVTISLTHQLDMLGEVTINVPLTVTAGPTEDGHVTVTVDMEGLDVRLTAAVEAFRKVAEA